MNKKEILYQTNTFIVKNIWIFVIIFSFLIYKMYSAIDNMNEAVKSVNETITKTQYNVIAVSSTGQIYTTKKINYNITDFKEPIAFYLQNIFISLYSLIQGSQESIQQTKQIIEKNKNLKFFYDNFILKNSDKYKTISEKSQTNFNNYLQYKLQQVFNNQLPYAIESIDYNVKNIKTIKNTFEIEVEFTNFETFLKGTDKTGKTIWQSIQKKYLIKAKGFFEVTLITSNNPLGMYIVDIEQK